MSVTDHLPELVQKFLDDARLFVALSKETNADTHTQKTEVKDFKTGDVYDVVLTVTKRIATTPHKETWEVEAQAWMDKLSILDLAILNNIVHHKLTTLHKADCERFRGMIGENEPSHSPKGYITRKINRSLIARNELRAELRTALSKMEEEK